MTLQAGLFPSKITIYALALVSNNKIGINLNLSFTSIKCIVGIKSYLYLKWHLIMLHSVSSVKLGNFEGFLRA